MWVTFAVLATLLFTVEGLLNRRLLRGEQDPWAFSFFFSLIGAIVSAPFAMASPVVPHTVGPWLLALTVSALIVAHNLLVFRASSRIEASLLGSLMRLRLIWVLVLGIVALGDHWSVRQGLGTLLVVSAGMLAIHLKRTESLFGLALILGATFLNASIVVLTKFLTGSFSAASVTLFASFLPAAFINYLAMPNAAHRVVSSWKQNSRAIIAACGAGALANLALNKALSLGSANPVIVINEMSLILVLAGESFLLKESGRWKVKLGSVFLAVLGAALVQLS